MRLMSFEPSGEILKLEKNIRKSVENAFNKPKMKAMLHGKPRNYRMVSISVIFRSSDTRPIIPDFLTRPFQVRYQILAWTSDHILNDSRDTGPVYASVFQTRRIKTSSLRHICR